MTPEESRQAQLTGVELGRSIGEQPHIGEHCDLDGRPHLGACVEPGTRTYGTFVADEWPDHPIDTEGAANLKRGDHLRLETSDGEEHHLVVVGEPRVDVDGTVRFEAADPDRVAAMERLAALGRSVDAAEAVGADEPHHAAARERTAGEAAALKARAVACASHTDLDRAAETVAAGYDRDRVLADVERRREWAERAAADVRPVPVSDLLRERLAAQVARRAAARGQLDLSGER